MTGGTGGTLNYTLFSNSTRTTEWTTTASINGTDVGTTPVYGRIPKAQNQPAGSYTDTVVATITF
jgi:spore coat protein U-like protein